MNRFIVVPLKMVTPGIGKCKSFIRFGFGVGFFGQAGTKIVKSLRWIRSDDSFKVGGESKGEYDYGN